MTRLPSPPEAGRQPEVPRSSLLARTDKVTLWIIGVASLVLLLLLARSALDVLVLIIAGGLLFVFERTVGDWLADAMGSVLRKVLFLAGVLLTAAVMLSFGRVRDLIWGALERADEAGFHSVLVERLNEMPAADPIQGDGVTGGRGAGGAYRAPAPRPGPAPSEDRASQSTRPSQTLTRTRTLLRLGGQGSSVVFSVDIIAAGPAVDEGYVEFSIDGRRVARANVVGGRAEARVGGISSGSHRATARFVETTRFSESIGEAAFTR